eukprot:TRINITY_DN7011_c0_g2_i1.p1 TRINITY_DN7011_c0_g2~~TRINITY_DN7011_c0_g2_i1.p1  ORF type:complete len:528 (+),score=60.93 TRINITY_DN7011_c0_g2_i1:75-1658(+)
MVLATYSPAGRYRSFVFLAPLVMSANAQITSVSVYPTGTSESGMTPTDLTVKFTPTSPIITTGSITITADAAIFAADASVYFTSGPTLTRSPDTNTVYVDFEASGTGKFWAFLVSESDAPNIDLTTVKSAQTWARCAGSFQDVTMTANAAMSLEFLFCTLSRSANYKLFVYIEANGLPGTLAELDIVVDMDVSTSSASYLSSASAPTMSGTGVSTPGALAAAVSGSSTTYMALMNSVGSIGGGNEVTVTIPASALTTLPTPGTVTVQVAASANTGSGTGTFEVTVAGTGSVSGDPVTWYGNRRAEFELPLNKLTTLLTMPDVELLAAPFEGAQQEQWIGRIVLRSKNSQQRSTLENLETLLQIDVHRDLQFFDRKSLTHEGREDLETMSALLNNQACGELRHMQFECAGGIWGVVSKVDCKFQRHLPCREAIVVGTKLMKISISSSPAREYYGSTPEAFRHIHLDIDAFDISSEKDLIQGALPEMWGFHPITPETRKLLTKGDPVDVSVNQTLTCTDIAQCQRPTDA